MHILLLLRPYDIIQRIARKTWFIVLRITQSRNALPKGPSLSHFFAVCGKGKNIFNAHIAVVVSKKIEIYFRNECITIDTEIRCLATSKVLSKDFIWNKFPVIHDYLLHNTKLWIQDLKWLLLRLDKSERSRKEKGQYVWRTIYISRRSWVDIILKMFILTAYYQ